MSGIVESSPGSGEAVGGNVAISDTPASGGLSDASPGSDSPFSLSEEVMNSSDLDEVEIAATPAAATEPEAPAQEGAAKPGEVKPAKVAEAAPAATPVKPAETKPEVAPVKPAEASPMTQRIASAGPQALLEELSKNRDQLISHLAETRFRPTKEEADLLDIDANAGIAKIAARVYYEAATSTMQQLQRFVTEQLPNLIDQHSQTNNSQRDAANDFYKEWPNLSKETDDSVVAQYANIYRQANPQASLKEAIEKVGLIVSTVLGKPKVAAAAAPAKPNGVRPFTPASGAARVVSQVPVPETHPFAGMGMDFE